ncbi:hypothetical protein BO94DRAFT_283263 [Aspergillus sclerotioniger CBS 115572]|uniref:Uncharacterized protein n=1 Tax=Aspergillus sclerotioniger CBS 115572 TaxID=1450535 RepID=A0A317XDX6_9EURO|nr:hypothetical protein BO94DRAFT_283263 [Aspergillus sclerotioniger CBS 115572]PWY94740.1 hypothetical protein BO94DRAFT_283263 [Aspergillus sclerotioniger CBS 115572]
MSQKTPGPNTFLECATMNVSVTTNGPILYDPKSRVNILSIILSPLSLTFHFPVACVRFIGAIGQSIHPFRCVYQEALARSKVTIRQKAVFIDREFVEGSDTQPSTRGLAPLQAPRGLTTLDFHLRTLLRPSVQIRHSRDAQIVAGIRPKRGCKVGLKEHCKRMWRCLIS